jgi:hypothetical protein
MTMTGLEVFMTFTLVVSLALNWFYAWVIEHKIDRIMSHLGIYDQYGRSTDVEGQ